jgi:two-component system, OmpR family, alkaline phosphatase synthesis response regulator PhoP
MAVTGDRKLALVVEDEPAIRGLLELHLTAAGFAVETTADGMTGLRLLQERAFDLVVLDVMLPGLDGVSICQRVRAGGPNVAAAILMVTARTTEADKVKGLESGADDYIAKPFGVRELLARVVAVTRRHARVTEPAVDDGAVLLRGALRLDVGKRVATVHRGAGREEPIELTRQEFDVLYHLAARPGRVFSRAALLTAVWPDDVYVTDRTVDTVISRLRRKIEQDPRDPELILTAWGVGYKFADGS